MSTTAKALAVVPQDEMVDEAVVDLSALLVEEDEACALPLSRALTEQGIVVDIARSLSWARRFLRDSGDRMDVVLVDPVLADGRGEDLLADIEALPRQPGVIILTNRLDEIRVDAISYRAIWVPKMVEPLALTSIMRRVAQGYVQNTLGRFASRFQLTRKETKALDGVASGAGPKQIAQAFGCSTQAIYALLTKICTKTKCPSYQAVVAKLFQFSCHGLGHPTWNPPYQ